VSADWALKVSDASGRYRGMFFFDNSYWLGSKEFCEDIDSEYREIEAMPKLQFFVVTYLAMLQPVNHKVNFIIAFPTRTLCKNVTAIVTCRWWFSEQVCDDVCAEKLKLLRKFGKYFFIQSCLALWNFVTARKF
jgi:hypothetical protein